MNVFRCANAIVVSTLKHLLDLRPTNMAVKNVFLRCSSASGLGYYNAISSVWDLVAIYGLPSASEPICKRVLLHFERKVEMEATVLVIFSN